MSTGYGQLKRIGNLAKSGFSIVVDQKLIGFERMWRKI